MPPRGRPTVAVCASVWMLLAIADVCEGARKPGPQARVDSSQNQPRPGPPTTGTRVKASDADSLEAQRRAWVAIRGMSHRTGTRAFRMQMVLKGSSAIVEALKIIPGDEWLNTMRVTRPMLGAAAPTWRASRAMCGGSPWWCDLVFFHRLYRADSVTLSDSLLQAGISAMAPHVRCVWGDVYSLVDRATAREYDHMTCEDRMAFQDRLWWLTDPFHSTPGNERRSEHFAREVDMRLRTEDTLLRTPGPMWALKEMRHGTHVMHGSDLLTEEGVRSLQPDSSGRLPERIDGFLDRAHYVRWHANPIRYCCGDSTLWEEMRSVLRNVRIGRAPRSYRPESLAFVPMTFAINNPFRAEPGHWRLSRRPALELSWSPVGLILHIEHQHGFFRRGDSSRLVLATDVSGEPMFTRSLATAAVATSRSPYERPAITRHPGSGPRYTFSQMVPTDSMLVSLEIIALTRGGARSRFGTSPPTPSPGRIQISDVLLLDPASGGTAASAQLESILTRVQPSTRINRGSAAGLFWEVYGLNAGDRPEITVVAIREPPGTISRLFGRVFGGAAPAELSTRFTDIAATGNGIEGRTIVIDFSTLTPGNYALEVRVALPGEQPGIAVRSFEIIRP